MFRILISVLILLFSGFTTQAATPFLQQFNKQPKAVIDELPEKTGDRVDKDFLAQKVNACRRDAIRKSVIEASGEYAQLLESSLQSFAGETEQAAKFLETADVIDDIQQIDKLLRKAQVSVMPWSGDYWAFAEGMAAKRYNDPGFTSVYGWKEKFDYFLANPPLGVSEEQLSPAEKYDLIVGDKNFSLTRANWLEGQKYFQRDGSVETWMGICHGWAPASFMEARPSHVVNIPVFNAPTSKVKLLPDDVKALVSLKWANGIAVTEDFSRLATHFLGGRCNKKDPAKDPDTGRITDPECFDLNPATWHVVITNQVGREKRPFIIDASFDYEVWNQPVTGYNFSYFNPMTMKNTEKLSEAMIDINDPGFTDKFAKFRNNPRAKKLVGILMYVSYVVEVTPSSSETNSNENDSIVTTTYHYDLELDENGKIIGGEWYQNRHPDFIWMPKKNAVAINNEDFQVNEDNDIMSIAPIASRRSVVPLKRVMDRIMKEFGPAPELGRNN